MTDGPLHALGAGGLLLALLLCGHTLGDFVFQTGAMVRRKREHGGWVWIHAAELTLVQAVVLLPLLSLFGVVMVLGIGFCHGCIDYLKVVIERRGRARLGPFVLDQGLHLVVLAAAWAAWSRAQELMLPGTAHFFLLAPASVPPLTTGAVVAAAYAFNVNGASAVVAALLRRFHLGGGEPAPGPGERGPETPTRRRRTRESAAMGRMIGILERMLVVTLVIVGQWGALGLVMAAKSIARFKDLDRRHFSEYYLIGTLASVLLATLSGLLVIWAL